MWPWHGKDTRSVDISFTNFWNISFLPTHAWYSTLWVSTKCLTSCLKEIHVKCGLVIDAMTKKSGRTTCVTRMSSKGVPLAIDMRITGHKSLGAYSWYGRALESHVKANQRCASKGGDYEKNVKEEIERFKKLTLKGKALVQEDTSPQKHWMQAKRERNRPLKRSPHLRRQNLKVKCLFYTYLSFMHQSNVYILIRTMSHIAPSLLNEMLALAIEIDSPLVSVCSSYCTIESCTLCILSVYTCERGGIYIP